MATPLTSLILKPTACSLAKGEDIRSSSLSAKRRGAYHHPWLAKMAKYKVKTLRKNSGTGR